MDLFNNKKIKELEQRVLNLSNTTWGKSSIDQWGTVQVPSSEQLINQYRNIIYACANMNATAVASTPIKLYSQTSKDTRKEITEHPFLDLIEQVNEDLDGYDLWELTTLYQELDGNCYWFIEKDNFGIPVGIYILPSQCIKLKQDQRTGKVIGYEYKPQGSTENKTYTKEQIIHFKYPDPRNPYLYGYSPTEACWEDLHLVNSNRSYENALLDNRARPEVVLSTPNKICPEAKEQLEHQWNQKFRFKMNGGVLIADDGITASEFSFSPKDIQSVEMYTIFLKAIANAFGVPMALLDSKTVARSQLDTAVAQYVMFAIKPRCTRMQQKINQKLMPMFDSTLYMEFDNPVPEDRVMETTLLVQQVNTGIITVNEARLNLDLPPIEGGDVLKSGKISQEPKKVPVSNNKEDEVNKDEEDNSNNIEDKE